MWGFHDRLLTLRRALYLYLKDDEHGSAIYRRWRWQQYLQNIQSGLIYSEEEWLKEWNGILRMASTEPRNSNQTNGYQASKELLVKIDESEESQSERKDEFGETYESLEEIHVLVLAHVIRR